MRNMIFIDGDIVLYRASHAAQEVHYGIWESEDAYNFGENYLKRYKYKQEANKNLREDSNEVVMPIITPKQWGTAMHALNFNFQTILDGVEKFVGHIDEVYVAVSCPKKDNFRHSLPSFVEYKGNRTQPKPYHLEGLREELDSQYDVIESHGLEADDILGMHAHEIGTVLVSLDKDLLTVPGTHYNWVTDCMVKVDSAQALRKFYAQLYQGDTADNVLGVPGIGPLKAESAIKEFKHEATMHQVVKYGYVKYMHDKSFHMGSHANEPETRERIACKWLNQNANLLWIQREGRRQWARDAETFLL